MVTSRHIIFPGRFQPISNAHIARLEWLLNNYLASTITIVIGDTGDLNKINFLTVEERVQIFTAIIREYAWSRIKLAIVQGCADGIEWAERIKVAVPEADAVASDNPFILEPLKAAGFTTITYERSGVDCSCIRKKKFANWMKYIPQLEWDMLCRMSIEDRMLNLPIGIRYPFRTVANHCNRLSLIGEVVEAVKCGISATRVAKDNAE